MIDADPKCCLTAQQVLGYPWLQHMKKVPNVSLGETVKARLKQFSVMNKSKRIALKDNVMKFCTMKGAFNHVAKKQRLSSSKSQEVINQITREINKALVKIQSLAIDKEAILSSLNNELNMMSLLNQIEGQQRDLDVRLSKLAKNL
ncbi:hypothetical protein GIB67_023244 [Kingdonia uniflora]|uniref:Uncharacterized protein n=1 Tax=Kingdonia uniflora TaxID=39325 RepID=A0A7J7L4D1_9MAGN|nr:hypothetical protein GIB67_023244 [Kingdonia uniflora]